MLTRRMAMEAAEESQDEPQRKVEQQPTQMLAFLESINGRNVHS